MDKLLLFQGKSERGIFTYVIDHEHAHLVKTAAEYHPEISNYINSARRIPGKTQILLTALGAGEIWGDNQNGDFFPEAALAHDGADYGHQTFKHHAKIYKHHINKDPLASYGDVALSVYNTKYRRVELIVVLDNEKAPDIAQRIDSGDYPDWSMGTRVPFDLCSNCGNKAPNRIQYCECLKYYMGRIHPETGKKVYAINTMPKFFDISLVLIGADRIAKTLKKVASAGGQVVGSALLAEKMADANKEAEIEKEVPAETPPGSQDLVDSIPEVKAQEPVLPQPLLDGLGQHPLSKVFSTMAMLGILPKPQEFQRIVLISIGKRDMANDLDSRNTCFDPMMTAAPAAAHEKLLRISGDDFSPQIMGMLSPHVPDRSYAIPHLVRRVLLLSKTAAPETVPTFVKWAGDGERKPFGIIPIMALLAGMYAVLGKRAPGEAVGKIDGLIAKHPGLAMALAASVPAIFNQVAGTNVRGQYDAYGTPENPDMNDLGRRIEERRQQPFLKVSSIIGPSAKRLFLGVPAAYMASGLLQKHRNANPYDQEGRVHRFFRQYPDLVGGAVALDAFLALKGGGTHGISKRVGQAAKVLLGKTAAILEKNAVSADLISSGLIWPLAYGPANLSSRIAGGVADHLILMGSRKILSKKNERNTITNTGRI
jgi:hypothetical protein